MPDSLKDRTMDKYIDVTIDPDGTIHIDMEGYSGTECEADFKKIVKALGTVVSQRKKPEYYQGNKVQIKGKK
jgi:biopolymer transport protein ExbD